MADGTRLLLFPDGKVVGLYTEEVPLQELGKLSVTRASSVEFNQARQMWEVRPDASWGDPDVCLFSDPSREACLAWESENILQNIYAGSVYPAQTGQENHDR